MHKLHPHHILFTPENPKHKSKFETNPSIEDVTKFLNQNGEDAQIIEGFYDGPEKSILVQNPQNVNGLMQMATDFGQDSILHSQNGKHTLHYLNGSNKGKKVTGEGTVFTKEKPANHFSTIHTVDGPLHFQHNLNFPEAPDSSESFGKSEDLNKAPLQYDNYDPAHSRQKGLPDIHNSDEYTQINAKKLPNGLIYRQYHHKNALPSKRVHALFQPGDDSAPLAFMETAHIDDPMADKGYHPNVVQWAEVDPEYRGKGLGRQLYLSSLIHLGQLTSDERISPDAHKAWKSLKGHSGIGGKIGKYPASNAEIHMRPDMVAAYENDRHHAFVRDKNQLNMAKMFPSVDLGKSEIKKSINSLNDLKHLEKPKEDDSIEMPEHLVLQWSGPHWRQNG